MGSSRAKDNAQKALEMLSTQRVQLIGSPRPIPPTTPVDHNPGKQKGEKKSKKESIVVDTVGGSIQASASPVYRNLDDLD